MTSADIIRRQQRQVDHLIVHCGGNWKRATALGGRGGGVDPRGGGSDHLVAGASRGGRRSGCRRRRTVRRRSRKGKRGRKGRGAAGAHQHRVAVAGDGRGGRRRRNGARRSRGRGGGTATIPASCGSPSTCESRRRRQGLVRCFWTSSPSLGRPEMAGGGGAVHGGGGRGSGGLGFPRGGRAGGGSR